MEPNLLCSSCAIEHEQNQENDHVPRTQQPNAQKKKKKKKQMNTPTPT